MKYFLYMTTVCMFSAGALFAETHARPDDRIQVKKEMIQLAENGIFLQVESGFIPLDSISFDAATNTYLVKPASFYTPNGVCGNGHPAYPAVGGCQVPPCPYFYGKWQE